jgi:chromosome partitioning protein
MRLDARTRATEVLTAWAADRGIPFIGSLRETQTYVKCVEQGLTIFDLPAGQAQADRAQWQSILEWLEPVLHVAPRAAARGGETRRVIDAIAARPVDMPMAAREVAPSAAMQMRPSATPVEPMPAALAPAPAIAPDSVVPTASMLRVPSATLQAEARVAPSSTFGAAKPASRPRASIFGWLPLPRFLQKHA